MDSAISEAVLIFLWFEEATNFDLRHPLWHQRMPRLAHAIDFAFTRTQTMSTPEEKFVYFYGTLVAEDFIRDVPGVYIWWG
jgi:hypothetical protein